jgi:hypothetical protein
MNLMQRVRWLVWIGMALAISMVSLAANSVVLGSTSVTVTEGMPGESVSVVLDSQPTDDVVVSFVGVGYNISVLPASLTFTAVDWDVPQYIVISAAKNGLIEPVPYSASVTGSASSDDVAFDGVSVPTIAVTINNADVEGIELSKTLLSVTEANSPASPVTDFYTVSLDTAPTADVVIDLSIDGSDIELMSEQLVFTPSNWYIPQIVTVMPFDDMDVEGTEQNIITHVVTSADAGYQGIAVPSVTVAIIDDDPRTGELIINGSFEDAGATEKRPLGWAVQLAGAKDRRACVGVMADGLCSFRFAPSSTEQTRLRQTVDLSEVSFLDGAVLNVSWAYKSRLRAKVRFILRVTFGDGTPDQFYRRMFGPKTGAAWTTVINPPIALNSSDVSGIFVTFQNFTTTHDVSLDAVSMVYSYYLSRGPLPLPPAQ